MERFKTKHQPARPFIMKGWRKRKCSLCGSAHYYSYRPIDAMELRDPDGVLVRIEAGQIVCEHCGDRNGALLHMQELPVLRAEKRCHACGGAGRIRRYRGALDLGPCRRCGGLGRVPTDAATAVLGEVRSP